MLVAIRARVTPDRATGPSDIDVSVHSYNLIATILSASPFLLPYQRL
jgi:hypothetical protein